MKNIKTYEEFYSMNGGFFTKTLSTLLLAYINLNSL
jgi:hypothetical protein